MMIQKSPVVAICHPEDISFYESFPLPGENLLIVSFGEAICSLLNKRVDLILLDCAFDFQVGLSLLSELKERFPNVPVLFATEQCSSEIVLKAYKLGARDFFQKPLPVFEVRDTIFELLNAKREVREHRRAQSADNGQLVGSGNLCNVGFLQPSIMKVVCYIESNYQKGISLQKMTDLAGMSKSHFVRQFSQETGMSPVRYLKFVRIQRAKELLKRDDLTVSAAGLRVGFQDVSNFNKNFRNIEGCTPTQYRANLS
jgi:AraC-like DNA-binding protein/CheY-like chemotaxis protein